LVNILLVIGDSFALDTGFDRLSLRNRNWAVVWIYLLVIFLF